MVDAWEMHGDAWEMHGDAWGYRVPSACMLCHIYICMCLLLYYSLYALPHIYVLTTLGILLTCMLCHIYMCLLLYYPPVCSATY